MQSPPAAGVRSVELERLRHRRQFALGPRFLDRAGWRRVELEPALRLTAHPDLAVTHTARGDRSVTLLGHLLDPDRPDATDEALVARLLDLPRLAEGALAALDRLGGRFALVLRDGPAAVVLHDACGLRSVCWAAGPGGLWCASSSGLVAAELGLEHDPEALAFMASRGESEFSLYWMPGDRTVHREVRCLLPNHLLDLREARARRFWPGPAPLPTVTGAAEAVPEVAGVLRGLVAAAARRGIPLAIPMTAGWDSRLVLALSRELVGAATCFTLVYPGDRENARDVAVPARLLARLGVPHRLVPYPSAVDPEVKAVFRESADAVKASYCADVQAMLEHLPDGLTALTGDVAEIAKCHWRLPGDPEGREATAADLGRLSMIGEHPYALGAFDDWLAGAPRGPVPLLDLFCWEQMAGRWQAQLRAEYDLAQESLAPLDCRALLARLLAVDPAARRGPTFPFFGALIEHLWPATLSEPVNPPERPGPRALAGKVLRRLGLYRFVAALRGRPSA
ncbi:MAG: hypothetical protein U0229_14420 [Anaeromyxobacter sp.]